MLSGGILNWLSGDQHLMALMAHNWLLGVLAVATIVFLETGLVVLPFLPGDSLLFATGAFLGLNGISPLAPICIVALAAVLGDGLNYCIGGSALGRQVLSRGWIKPRHVRITKDYFERYGAPTITIGRFVPVVRTIAPFMAGLSGMPARRFALFNVLGAAIWSPLFLLAGHQLGGIHWVGAHLGLLSAGVIGLSLLPVAWHLAARFGFSRG
ncbi:MAG: VTT domain-containing protein [Rhodocyclaceae bacterium]|nr:VTT domain-containing protein [Rhodocyclaceae bacterium]